MMNLELITEKPVSGERATPLLFVHGMWHGAWCWAEYFLPFFAKHGFFSQALSLRGHGSSGGRERLRRSSLADYVSDVTDVAGRMEKPPVVIGHSMGGMVVQKYLEAHHAPAAVLLASAPPGGVVNTTFKVLGRHPLAFLKANLTLSMYPIIGSPALTREAFFSEEMPADKLMDYFSRMQDDSYRVYLDMLGLNLPRPKKVKTPLLVLGAEKDSIFSISDVEKTARAYKAEAVIITDIAHDMMLDNGWQAVADRILQWLAERGL